MREILKSARIAALPAIMAVALSAFTLPSGGPTSSRLHPDLKQAMQACIELGRAT